MKRTNPLCALLWTETQSINALRENVTLAAGENGSERAWRACSFQF